MRIRLRAPAGSSTITLAENATIQDLTTQITTQTGIQKFDIRYGYPPQPLLLQEDQKDTLVRDLDVKLDGEQLTIGSKDEPVAAAPAVNKEAVAGGSGVKREKDDKKLLALKKKAMEGDVPEIPMPERGATLVLRVMPDDNSCLFRAFATAVLPDLDSTMHELRSLVATYIQSDPQKYTKVVLEKEPSEYCRWIQREESWGGAIEMQILAEHYEVEICSIDVKSGQPYRFNTTAPNRCILVYSGIHYDTVVQSPSEPPHTSASLTPPEFDRRIWESEDEEIISRAQELCARLKAKNYYTDTGSMGIRCNTCGWVGNGQMEASRHFQDTMHVDMAEVQ